VDPVKEAWPLIFNNQLKKAAVSFEQRDGDEFAVNLRNEGLS